MLLYLKAAQCLFVLFAVLLPYTSAVLLARDEDHIPSGNNWVQPTKILDTPGCTKAGNDSDGCPKPLDLVQCTSIQCTKSLFGGCMERENLTNTACLCNKYSSDSCKACDRGGVARQRWFRWLNATCSSVSGWSGLPANWDSQTSSLDVIPVGNFTDAYYYRGDAPFYTLNYSQPACANNTCPPFSGCLANGSDIPWLYSNSVLYLDRSCMCTSPVADFSNTCTGCTSPLERTRLLTWYNATCYNATGFSDTSSEWAKDLLLIDQNHLVQSELIWPDCVGGSACTPSLNDTEVECTSTRCKPGSDGNCVETLAVERACFCKDLSYGKSCNGTCELVWERQDYLNWLNTTCSPVAGWSGLPANWTQLLNVQDAELLPWHWEVQTPDYFANASNATHLANDTNSTTDAEARPQCPSTAAKIGVYAAVNAAIAILVPILGRRTVIHRLTFGVFGNPWSRSWLITGSLSIGLQIGSNVLNAYMVTQVPGFAQVPIGDLTLLWCTRPRLAWLVIALLPVQSAEAMYFSVAASCLAAELVLQLVGSVYMGYATNYARQQRFYLAGALDSSPYRTDARIMYAGSLLWLVVIGFALFAAAWSVLRVNDHISSLGKRLQRPIRLSRKRHKATREALSSLLVAEEECQRNWAILAESLHRLEDEGAEAEARAAREHAREVQQRQSHGWHGLAEEWRFLHDHLTVDDRELKKARKRAKKLKVELSPGENDADRAEFSTAGYLPHASVAMPGAAPNKPKDRSNHVQKMRAARAELERLEAQHREIPAARVEKADCCIKELKAEIEALHKAWPRVPTISLHRLANPPPPRPSPGWRNRQAPNPRMSQPAPTPAQQQAAKEFLQRISADCYALDQEDKTALKELELLKAQWEKVRRARRRPRARACAS